MIKFIVAFLVIIPNFYWWGYEQRISQEWVYQLFGIALFLVSLLYNKHATKANETSKWLSLFCLWSLFLYCYGQLTFGFNYLMNTFIFILIYMITVEYLKKKDIKLVFNAIIAVALFNTVYAIFQSFGYDIVGVSMRGLPLQAPEPCGLFGLPAHLGIYAGVAMCCAAYFNPYYSLVFLIPLAMSKSTGAVIGAFVGYMTILWLTRTSHRFMIPVYKFDKNKRFKFTLLTRVYVPIFYVFLIGSVTCSYLYIKHVDMPMGMFPTRPGAWGLMINEALANPVMGHGLDSIRNGNVKFLKDAETEKTVRSIRTNDVKNGATAFDLVAQDVMKLNVSPDTHWDIWDNCHNGYIQVLYEHSLSGLGLVFMVLFSMYKRLKRVFINREISCLIGIFLVYLVSSTTQFPFYLARLGHLVPVILGLYIIHTE